MKMNTKELKALLLFFIGLILPLAVLVAVKPIRTQSYVAINKYPFPDSSPIRFNVVGDLVGMHLLESANDSYTQVSHLMKNQALEYPVSFLVFLGNNLNSSSAFDQKFYSLMNEVFNGSSLSHKPWLSIPTFQNCEFPFSDYERLYPNWNMPSNYYNLSISIDHGFKAAFTFLDSSILLGNNTILLEEHYAWLQKILSEQNADNQTLWKLVVIHTPLWASGSHNGDNEILKQRLYPILSAHKVDLLLTGHEDIMSHHVSRFVKGIGQPYKKLSDSNYYCSGIEFYPYGRSSNWRKGEAIHQATQGTIGQVCTSKTTSMANLLYANSLHGYSQIYIDSHRVQIDYFNIKHQKSAFTVRIFNK